MHCALLPVYLSMVKFEGGVVLDVGIVVHGEVLGSRYSRVVRFFDCSGAGSAAPRSTKRWVGSTTSTFYSDLISQSEHTTKYVL